MARSPESSKAGRGCAGVVSVGSARAFVSRAVTMAGEEEDAARCRRVGEWWLGGVKV